jgi:hypothetical protein
LKVPALARAGALIVRGLSGGLLRGLLRRPAFTAPPRTPLATAARGTPLAPPDGTPSARGAVGRVRAIRADVGIRSCRAIRRKRRRPAVRARGVRSEKTSYIGLD